MQSCERCHAPYEILGIEKDSDPHISVCLYCGVEIPCESNPETDEEWKAVAELHGSGCEWVVTRAHTYSGVEEYEGQFV